MDNLFLNFDFEISDVYRALDYFKFYKDDLLLNTHEMVRSIYGRDMKMSIMMLLIIISR